MKMLSSHTKNILVDYAYIAQKVCSVLLEELQYDLTTTPSMDFETEKARLLYEYSRQVQIKTSLNVAWVQLEELFPKYKIQIGERDEKFTLLILEKKEKLSRESVSPYFHCVSYREGTQTEAFVSIMPNGNLEIFEVYCLRSEDIRTDIWKSPINVSSYDIPQLMRTSKLLGGVE